MKSLEDALRECPAFPSREYALYLLFHLLASPFLALNGWRRARKRGYGEGVWRRLAGGDKPPKRDGSDVVIFAGGLGEVRVAARMASLAREHGLSEPAILTRADDSFAADASEAFLGRGPFNNPVSVLLFLRRWKPRAILTIEFADNHHLKALARLAGVRQIVVNVPITEAEKERVLAKGGDLWRWLPVDAYLCAAEDSRRRLIEIGVPDGRALVTGPLALAPDPDPDRATVRTEVRAALKLTESDTPVLVAGSTYPPEEDVVLRAFETLRRERPKAVLILAPRRLDRPEGIAIPGAVRRSEGYAALPESRVVVLDTYGELGRTYSVADLALVGGTYGVDLGGHTPMEAIAWGVPVLVGPSHAQQAPKVGELVASGAAKVWRNPDDLGSLLVETTGSENLPIMRKAAENYDDSGAEEFVKVYRTLLGSIQEDS